MVPRENKNNAYAKFGGTNKEYYGIFRNGLLIACSVGLFLLVVTCSVCPLQDIKEARKGFFGCYSVCETMKDTKEG